MIPYFLIISTVLLNYSFSFQKIDTIDKFLSDPFYKSLYVPLTNINEGNVRKISDILNHHHYPQDEDDQKVLKSHMEIVYGINADKEAMRTRKREPFNQNEEMMRTRKREPLNQNEEMMRTRKREPMNQNEEMMRTRKREPLNQNEEMMRTRKREPLNQNEEMMRTRKREPLNQNEIFNSHEIQQQMRNQNEEMMRTRKREPLNQNEEMMRTRKREPCNENEIFNSHENIIPRKVLDQNEEMMRTRKREPLNQNEEMMRTRKREPYLESCDGNQFLKYDMKPVNSGCISERNVFYGDRNDHKKYKRHVVDGIDQAEVADQILQQQELEARGGLPPIKRFDFNQSIIEHFFDYDSNTLSHIVMEILDQRSQENYDSAFIEVFKVINKDSYDDKPVHEKVFLFRKFLRMYKEFNDETLRGVMFDLPRKLKNYAIKRFLSNNPKGRDYLSYWETEEEIDIRFRNLYQQFQYALIERNYEMEQQLYELACPHGYTEMMIDVNATTNSMEALSMEAEEERLRAHAKKYLRKKLNSVAMLVTTTADPYEINDVKRVIDPKLKEMMQHCTQSS